MTQFLDLKQLEQLIDIIDPAISYTRPPYEEDEEDEIVDLTNNSI